MVNLCVAKRKGRASGADFPSGISEEPLPDLLSVANLLHGSLFSKKASFFSLPTVKLDCTLRDVRNEPEEDLFFLVNLLDSAFLLQVFSSSRMDFLGKRLGPSVPTTASELSPYSILVVCKTEEADS